jgi:hypothetical protein
MLRIAFYKNTIILSPIIAPHCSDKGKIGGIQKEGRNDE